MKGKATSRDCRLSNVEISLQMAFGITLLLAYFLSAQTAAAFEASIERDALGVPHIYGETDADMAFGLAYAQAEDGWEILEETLPY